MQIIDPFGPVQFGAWENCDIEVVYKAETDGFGAAYTGRDDTAEWLPLVRHEQDEQFSTYGPLVLAPRPQHFAT